MDDPEPTPDQVSEDAPRPAQLDIGRCFEQAIEVYQKNFVILVVAALLTELLSLFSLFILAGPLSGGWCRMTLNALRREDRRIDFNDLFAAFNQFWPLVGLFLVTGICVLAGLFLCVAPGVLLATVWLFPFYVMVERNADIGESLRQSYAIVKRGGFGINLLLALIVLALEVVSVFVPYLGWVLGWVLTPLASLALTSGYLQQVGEQTPAATDEASSAPNSGDAFAPATCARCGYNLRSITTFFCPECGADLRETGMIPPAAKNRVGFLIAAAVTVGIILILVIFASIASM